MSRDRVIVVTSGKGGVGKTTTTAHLGCALARRGQRVALLDADIGLRNLDVILGLEGRILYDIVDVVRERCTLSGAMIEAREPNLYLLAAAQQGNQRLISRKDMDYVVERLASRFDWVLIDCPAGIERGFDNAVSAAGRAIVVTTPDVAAVRDAARVAGLLREKQLPARMLINRYQRRLARRGTGMGITAVADIVALPLLGVVPNDEHMIAALNRGKPLNARESRAGYCYDQMADSLMGEPTNLLKRGIWGRAWGRDLMGLSG